MAIFPPKHRWGVTEFVINKTLPCVLRITTEVGEMMVSPVSILRDVSGEEEISCFAMKKLMRSEVLFWECRIFRKREKDAGRLPRGPFH